MNRFEVQWDDLEIVMSRMQGRRLLEVKARPGTVPGHILSIAAFGRAARRQGRWYGAKELIWWYAAFKKVDEYALMAAIEAYWKDTGHLYGNCESIIEELSRI